VDALVRPATQSGELRPPGRTSEAGSVMRSPKPQTLPRGTSGMAGVFWVASVLARRNWIAFPTVRNQKGVDIIATKETPRRTKLVEVQVKSSQKHTARFWLLGTNERNRIPRRDSLFFIFVRPRSDSPTEFEAWIVPSEQVRKRAHHSPHGTVSLCWWVRDSARYEDNWGVLEN
jgi:hypothetical protein